MARTFDITNSRAAGFALLKPADKPQLDAARIATLSGTIAVNALAMGLLMMPLTLPPPAVVVDQKPQMQIDWIPRQQVTPPIEVEVVRTPPKPETRPTVQPPRAEVPAAVATPATPVLSESGSELAVETGTPDASGPITSIEPATAVPAPTQLQYVTAPAPTYPRSAMRAGITGTVMLQVLVGVDGRPLEVRILQSSGNRELDAAARSQVLKRWSFQPAMKNGQAVQALGVVPIQFKLQ